MKTTITVNLNNLLFHIEEDAYNKLKAYLSQIEKRFKNSEGYQDIIGDIETRISELLKERLGKTREVANITDVEEIIKIIGSPDDFGEPEKNENQSKNNWSNSANRKRLYRDPDHKVLGGVCGGIGAYFNTDPVLVRVIFLVAFLGAGVGLLIYIILWIVVPEANTPAEKAEMHGEPFNISNIGKNVKDEFNDIKNRMKR